MWKEGKEERREKNSLVTEERKERGIEGRRDKKSKEESLGVRVEERKGQRKEWD